MTHPENRLRWLATRLNWPSLLVRERACTALAQLLVDPIYGEVTRVFLARWIREQSLESAACNGLLVLVRAQMEQPDVVSSLIAEVAGSFSQHSLLSWLLFKDMLTNDVVLSPTILRHADDAPSDWQIPSFFERHVRSFLPPIYMYWADRLERNVHVRFIDHWSYEWQLLVNQMAITPSAKPLDFWIGRSTDKERYAGADLRLSDVYRTAYLRTLAWAINRQKISESDALWLAAQTCPVDLELWKIHPQTSPQWWPRVSVVTGTIDTSAATIWQQVTKLWEAQQSPQEQWPSNDYVLGYASGSITSGKIVYDLDICGVFQRRHGSDDPILQEVVDWYMGSNVVRANFVSPLRCRGDIPIAPVSRFVESFGGWRVVPAAVILREPTTPRWQMWRMRRRIWSPAPCILPRSATVYAENSNLVYSSQEYPVGYWSDWTDDLREKRSDDLPFLAGQQLLIARSTVNAFARASTSNFCWICRLRSFYRERDYEPYRHVDDIRVFGVTSVIRV